MITLRPATHRLRALAAAAVTVGALALPLIGGVAPASAAVLPVGSSGGANLVFNDEFSGTSLNTAAWQTCAWWSNTTCSIETNNELELYTKNNVSVAGGALKLQARRETAVGWNGKSYDYTSGMVRSGFTFTYGYMEARVMVPKGQGLWPAFWTLPADHSWPPEIDAMEILGQAPNVQHMTYHYLNSTGAEVGPGSSWTGPDFSAGWHTFGVDWQPNALVWYVDGVERWRFTDPATITGKPQYLVLNLAVGGNWPGSPQASTVLPSSYLVDYVRVWDHFGPAAAAQRSTYATAVAADSPNGSWRLGETTGSVAADSNGNDVGTYLNGVTQGAAGLLMSDPANPAAAFDGANDVVAVPSTPNLSPSVLITLEAWIRPAAIPATGSFKSVVTKAESYSLQFNGPMLEFTTMQNGARRRVQAPSGAIVAGQTYHVVGTYDGAVQRLYVNGKQLASAPFSGAMSTNTNRLLLGSWDANSEFFGGTIDEVALYPNVLSPSQIATHYSVGSATP